MAAAQLDYSSTFQPSPEVAARITASENTLNSLIAAAGGEGVDAIAITSLRNLLGAEKLGFSDPHRHQKMLSKLHRAIRDHLDNMTETQAELEAVEGRQDTDTDHERKKQIYDRLKDILATVTKRWVAKKGKRGPSRHFFHDVIFDTLEKEYQKACAGTANHDRKLAHLRDALVAEKLMQSFEDELEEVDRKIRSRRQAHHRRVAQAAIDAPILEAEGIKLEREIREMERELEEARKETQKAMEDVKGKGKER